MTDTISGALDPILGRGYGSFLRP